LPAVGDVAARAAPGNTHWRSNRVGPARGDDTTQEDVVANQLAERYAELLLEKISSDKYPSTTQMDMLESIAPPRELVAYILHLMEKIENDRFPSVPMMERVQRLISLFGP
jgi:hypothetical protein